MLSDGVFVDSFSFSFQAIPNHTRVSVCYYHTTIYYLDLLCVL